MLGSGSAYSKVPGLEPLPGYRLVAPLGRGGFGEVWRCEAPGGLPKAVKFVAPDPDAGPGGSAALRQEAAAFERIRAVRHPFILQLERVEVVGGELVMVMELADGQLQDRFAACAAGGRAGIPRDELLGYFADAAEALDVMGAQHGLQHLDVKPANLFLVGGHVKVGDYGLVARLDPNGPGAGEKLISHGLTPRYVAPEVLNGRVDPRSDQYSLALVYQELLTGTFAYPGRTPAQLLLQHVTGKPDLAGLPESDRGPVARALAKNPAERFPSCSEFVRALMAATPPPRSSAGLTTSTDPSHVFRKNRLGRSAAGVSGPAAAEEISTVPEMPPLTVTGDRLPALVTPAPLTPRPPRVSGSTAVPKVGPAAPRPLPRQDADGVRLTRIVAVTGVGYLLGDEADPVGYSPAEYVDALMTAAAGWAVPRDPGEVARLPDGTWGCRFPTGLLPAVAPLKLTALMEDGWCDEVTQPEPGQIVVRVRVRGSGGWGSTRQTGGVMATVQFPPRPRLQFGLSHQSSKVFGEAQPQGPPSPSVGEVTVVAELYGDPGPEFVRRANEGTPRLLGEIRRVLQTSDERRKTRRLPFDTPVIAHPITSEGIVLPTVTGRCRDVSASGVGCTFPAPLPSRHAYLEFPGLRPVAGRAILTKFVRTIQEADGCLVAGPFRTDI